MPFQVELPPVPEERLRATAEWIQRNVHPVANLVETAHDGEPAQPFEVREHQVEALAREWQAREEGQERALGHLATGGGKTTLWVIDTMKYREECAQSDVPMIPRFLYVSPQHEINRQAVKRLQRFIPDADIEFFDTRKARNRPEADFTFATIQSLYSKLDTFNPEDFENIFWDEAHHLEAKTFKKVLEHFRPLFESAATATVERMDKKDIQDYWGEPVYSKGLPDGLAEGWLADVEYHIIFDKAVREEVAKGFHPKTLKEIEELFEKKVSPEALAESIREEIERLGLEDPKTMIFCESVEEADEMAELLGGKAYHSYAEDQEQILKDFKSGKITVVTARDMLNEGVDVPDAEVVIFLRGTKSGSLWEQQLGRGLRKIFGKDKVYVLDFVANIERVAKVRELSDTVQKKAGKKGGPGGTTGGDGCGGINIHTKHSEFDFDTLAVDLLERWGALKSISEAPEGWMSVNGFSRDYNFPHTAIHRAIQGLGIKPQAYILKGKPAVYLSPDEQIKVYDVLAQGIPSAPDEVVSVNQFAQLQGINYRLVLGTAQELNQSLKVFQFGPTPGKGLDSEQQKLILGHLLANLPKAEADCKTINELANEIGVSETVVRRTAELEGLELKSYRFSRQKKNKIALGLTPEQQEKVRESSIAGTPEAPEGYLSVIAYATQVGVTPKTIYKVIGQLEMSLDEYRLPTGASALLSPDQQAQLSEQEVVRLRPPEGYVSVNGFATAYRIGNRRVKKTIEEMGLQLSNYFFHSHKVPGLSPDDQRLLCRKLGLKADESEK